MVKAVLFDLDGTLLPMDNDYFTKCYLKLLGKKFYELGYDGEKCIKGVWNGLKHMVGNDGSMSNEDAFWKGFDQVMASDLTHERAQLNTLLLGFYQNEFHGAKAATAPSHIAKDIVEKVKRAGHKVILATNPIFPKEAVLSRLSWIDLTEEDFDYITTYETSHFCKPNPDYYKEILDKCELEPQDCIMIGNDVHEDIIPALSLQIPTYLVKDYQIGEAQDISTDAGSLAQVVSYLNM